MADPPRFSFNPLERRGVLLGVQGGQLVTMAAGAVMALALHGLLGGAPGTVVALLLAGGSVLVALWTREGQPLIAWALIGMGWVHHRGGRTQLSSVPEAGVVGPGRPALPPAAGSTEGRRRREGLASPPWRARPGPGPLPGGIDVVDFEGGPVEARYGVIRDRRCAWWSVVIPVTGRSFSLLDSEEQVQQLEAWRTVMAAVGRPDSPVARLQWVRRSGPAVPAEPFGLDPVAGSGRGPRGQAAARDSYRQLMEAVGPSAQAFHTWLVLAVGGDRQRRSSGPPESVGRELRFLQGQLRQAGLDPGPALAAPDLRRLVSSGTLGMREGWSALQLDGDWHATFWVAEWPRLGVGPDFLLPLLVGRGRRTVSMVAAPVAADRALREARSARTADLADAQLRSRAGFLSSARRDREAEGAVRREQELAEGHAEFRFSAYVSVAAGDEAALALACAELQQSAQAAHLELRRLYGRQAEALTWTMPVGRGLR